MSEHDHQHEHDISNEQVHHENCTCGNDHAVHDHPAHNEHIHHEDCVCHSEERDALGTIHVECHLHDEARVVSGSLALFADYGKLRMVLSDQLEVLAKAVQERGGIVGHIKASVETKQVEMFSVTDVAVSVKSAPGQEVKINLASIVFAIDAEVATMLVTNALEATKAGV